MKPRAQRRWLLPLLATALLALQQGFFVSGASAQNVSQGAAATNAGSGVSGAVGAVPSVQLGNLPVNTAAPLAGSVLPGVSVVPKVAPSAGGSAAALPSPLAAPKAAVLPTPAASKASAAAKAAKVSAPQAGDPQAKPAVVPEVGPAGAVADAPAAQTPGPSGLSGAAQGASGVVEKLKDPFDTRKDHPAPAKKKRVVSGKDEVGWADMPEEPAEAPSSIKQVSLEPAPGQKFTPSPEDWRDEIIYSLVIDRFGRTAPFTTWGDPADGRTRHGGNIRGLTDRLDYLKGLGVTTILINPLTMSPPAGYHQYWPVHFMAVDPQIGTMEDFKQLVAEAHKRGLRIVLDVVFNHTGPIIEYEGGWKYGSQPKKIKEWKYTPKPTELADERHFHRRGSIDDWHNPEQVQYGDFPGGLNQLATENPLTQEILISVAKWWLKETDIDGYRLDTYMHVNPSFWTRFFKDIRAYADTLGKKNFLLLGELYHGDPNALRPELGGGRLDAAYNYPAYFWDEAALHGQAPTSILEASFKQIGSVLGRAIHYLVRFLDNQDKPRFLRPNDPVGILKVALAYTLMTVGIPYVYYGTEHAFRQNPGVDWGMDGYREDMFAEGKFKSPSSSGDNFDPKDPLYQHLSRLAEVRKAHPALSRGEQYVRWSDPNGPGVFAFSRIHGDEEVLVVLNTADSPRSAEMWVDGRITPPGTELVDAMSPGDNYRSYGKDGGSKLTVHVPPHGVRILVRRPAKR